MQHAQRPAIDGIQRPQGRQRKAVVAAERDELRLLQQRRHRGAAAQLRESLGHLPQRDGIIHRYDGDVPAVEDGGPVLIRVDVGPGVEAAEGRLAGGGLPDGTGAESCAWEEKEKEEEQVLALRESSGWGVVCVLGRTGVACVHSSGTTEPGSALGG